LISFFLKKKFFQEFAMEQVETSAPKTIWQKVETVFFLLSRERRKNTVQKKNGNFFQEKKLFSLLLISTLFQKILKNLKFFFMIE
jgi:hypothetical protein